MIVGRAAGSTNDPSGGPRPGVLRTRDVGRMSEPEFVELWDLQDGRMDACMGLGSASAKLKQADRRLGGIIRQYREGE